MPRSPVKKSRKKAPSPQQPLEDDDGFLSDGYDADLYGDHQDRAYLLSLPEVQREAILYDRAQARQARAERRVLEQRLREREGAGTGTGKVPVTQADVKRKRLEELRAKRSKRQAGEADEEEEEEEGEATSDASEASEAEYSDDYAERKRKQQQRKQSKQKRRTDDSDEDYWQDEVDVISSSTGTGKSKKLSHPDSAEEISSELFHTPLDLEYANKLRLSRDILAQWIYREGVEDVVSRCLLRVNVGVDKHNHPTYRIAELKKLVPASRVYFIKAGAPTDMALRAVIAKSERDLRMDVISNAPFTEEEFAYWRRGLEEAKVKLPYASNGAAKKKIAQLKAFHAQPLTDAIIAGMIEKKRQVMKTQHSSSPRDLLAEQTLLQQHHRKALEQGDHSEATRLAAQLEALQAKKSQQQSRMEDVRLAVMDDLNRRNRAVNLETGRLAELAADSAGAEGTTSANDPFQRRKCKPRIIDEVGGGGEGGEEEDGKGGEGKSSEVEVIETAQKISPKTTPTAPKSTPTVDLFAAHDFELEIDL